MPRGLHYPRGYTAGLGNGFWQTSYTKSPTATIQASIGPIGLGTATSLTHSCRSPYLGCTLIGPANTLLTPGTPVTHGQTPIYRGTAGKFEVTSNPGLPLGSDV